MVSCESARAGIEGSEHDDDDMSLQVSAMLEKTDWVEELQRKVFEECAAQSQQKANLLPAEDSDALENVPVSVIVGNIHQNFAKIPHFRQRTDFLEELRESLQRVAKDNQVNWYEFKDSSASWFLNLLNLVREDGNNNVRQLNHSDAPAEDSEKDRLSMEERSCSDAIDDDYLNSYSLNQMDTAASCYSLNSSSMGVGTTDSTMESSEEGDHISENIAGVDLKVRIRRYNEETANLKEELLRTEETNSILERDIKSLQSSLEQMTNKFSKLQKDFREQRDMLVETEQREESCKLDLRKLEKANAALQKKMEALEKENKNILNLKAKIDEITKKNAELLRQIADYKGKYNAKTLEFEYLQEEYNDLQNKNSQLEKSYEKKFEHYQEKIQELQSLNAELQSRMNKSNTSSEMSFTPPPYNSINAQIHSTPYNNHKNRHHDSLYSELKASGFTIDDAKIQDLKEELSFYNEEIYIISQQADEALQDIAALKNEICVPSVQLVEMDNIQTLKHKITTLVNMVKTCTAIKAPSALRMGDESREKPDVLPETTKTMSCLANERLFASEKQENDLIGSVTSGMTPVPQIRLRETCDKSTSPLRDVTDIQTENSEASKIQPETIVPIAEALKRINEIKAADDEEDVEAIRRPSRIPRQKSVYTNKNTDWHHLLTEASKSKAACFTKNINNRLNSETFNNAKGDGSHRELLKPKKLNSLSSYIHSTTDMKTLKSESKDYTASPEEIIKIDAKYVTIRPKLNEETYSVSPTVSSTEGKSDFEQSKLDDVKSINSTFVTPVSSAKFIPRRKLSVYHRSFDVDSLQTSDSLQISTSEKRRSISTPDGQETDLAGLRAKSIQPLEPSMAKSELLITYRSTNISDSSDSPSPQKSSLLKDEESTQEPPAIIKTIILAPSKLKLPDSIVNQTLAIEPEIENSKSSISQSITSQPIIFQSTFPKNHYSFGRLSGEGTEQSRILSSSENLIRKEKNNLKNNGVSITLASCNVGSSTALSNVSAVNTSSNSVNGLNMSDNIVLRNIEKNDKTYLKKISYHASDGNAVTNTHDDATCKVSKVDRHSLGVDTDETRKSDATAALNASTTSVATDSVLEEISLHYSSSGGGANGGGVDVVGDKSNGDVPTVERAMSSGEDSSADSECDARSPEKTAAVPTVTAEEAKKPPAIGVDSSVKPVLGRINDVCSKENGRKRMDDVALREDKVEKPQTTNRKEKENSCQKVTSNSSPIEVIKEDESPKAFPSWTDEKLHESGIASLVEIDAEISENLSEEELKKKYTAFSVGLSTDRMTLSKRIILSRRHRDQAEKNFTNEVLKMQQDIKELAPLCVDSESVERVERVKQQLEMVARCAHRISCSAETLGAVHQERRVSRAVLLADRYLQTLRSKCEKLAHEFCETKRILAENNIVLEENLCELGEDAPRMRYRAEPNNNRTMVRKRKKKLTARRRASIATISRPLMGSNQDISKDLPRQRNSVSGRVPGLRRPSLCYEAPKWEIEKLDRTDSSSSIAELRDIFEQAESRRHSREENNNNLIRTSINNLSTIASEHVEEEEVWSNSRDDIVPHLANDNEVNSLELGQHHRHPLVCWLSNRYAAWRSTIWGIFIAFILGFFINKVVSSSSRSGPPVSWWSIEEILNQYIQVENEKQVRRPI